MLAKAQSSVTPDPETVDKVSKIVASLASKEAQTRHIGPADSLTDAGVSSLDMVNLMLALEAAFDVFIPADLIKPSSFRTIISIATMLDGLRPPLSAVA